MRRHVVRTIVTASDNGLSLGIRLLPGETAARLDEYLRDAKGSFVSFLSSVHIAPVEFSLDFDARRADAWKQQDLFGR